MGTNIYNDDAECYPENMTMLYEDGATGFCHNKKKLEAALNAKIICDDDAECYPEGMTTPYEDNATGFCQDDATGFCHSMKKLEKLFKPPSGCIKCKDHKSLDRASTPSIIQTDSSQITYLKYIQVLLLG